MSGNRRERHNWDKTLALWSRWLVVSVGLLAVLTVALAVFAMEILPNTPAVLDSRTGVLAASGVLALLTLELGAFLRVVRGLRERMNQQADLANTYLQRWQAETEKIQTLREQRHDLRNQLTVLSALLQMGAVDKALRYIRNLAQGRQRQDSEAGAPASGSQGDSTGKPPDSRHIVAPFLALLSAKHDSARERAVRFTARLELDPHMPVQLVGDPDFTRIAGNLIDNALDAAIEGRDRSPEVEIGLVWTPRARELWVANTGPAIPPEYLDLIFTAGFSTKGGDHQGLGLPVVHRLVTERGGQVLVDNDSRQRTRFRVIFPPLGEPGAAEPGAGEPGHGSQPGPESPKEPEQPPGDQEGSEQASDTPVIPPSA